ncbi:hypothetical protein [Nitratireductor sp. ZSWI3]|uniref:hypothetical protein n=1 Tax=Nitratireductor sp. ZSWI3 TaxID=2966359 RepID=UPI00214FFB52|nr:hypothetical protein [Nitratireductor sp. ZSWI3]MCR4267395.1 hypothetical protein [Nitratireductor sp. ZSWI3]
MSIVKRADFADWCRYNGIDACFVEGALLALAPHCWVGGDANTATDAPIGLEAEQAWSLASDVFCEALPALQPIIRRIGKAAPRGLLPRAGKHPQPFTYHRGAGRLPFVSCSYEGRAADLLAVVHEFAHALQLVASRRSPMPPMAREVCAFLGELFLLRWLSLNRPDLQGIIECAWVADNARYLGPDAANLLEALRAPSARYVYRWNYPIARLIAQALLARDDTALIQNLFRSGAGAHEVFAGIEPRDLPRLIPGLLPPMPASAPGDRSAVYRQVGAILLLDLQDDAAAAETAIIDRYASLFEHMRTGTAFLALSPFSHPLGYAVWSFADPGSQTPEMHSCAPFGRHETLFDTLRKTLPHAAGWLPPQPQGRQTR